MTEPRSIGPDDAETSAEPSSPRPLPQEKADIAAWDRPAALADPDARRRWPVRGRALIGIPVDVDGIEQGRVRDIIVDAALDRVLGLKVQRPCGRQSFVPWVAVSLAPRSAGVHSAHALLSTTELAFYVDRGALLTELPEPSWDLIVGRGGDVQEVVRGVEPRETQTR